MAEPFRIYNSLTRTVEDFRPLEEGRVGLYVCGMTVYDHCHVGHACAMVIFDTLVRYLRHRGWEVTFVRNFTDVDDKIIGRAAELGEEPIALAQRYIDAFHRDADELGLLRPDEEPRVSTSIDSILALIERLVANGNAYESEGSVWFSVKTFSDYGKLSGQKVEELRSAEDAEGKTDPADFALWKAVKPGEPSWDSPWGAGRPGWHIECSAMCFEALGTRFDIHGGGLDLIFPHHENEVAQSECGNSTPFANYWLHNGLLTMSGGQKMGKSLGNVINVHKALEEFPSQTLRLYYLQNHYRSSLPWNEDALPEALAMVARLYEARETAEAMGGDEDPDHVAQSLGADAIEVLALGRSFESDFHAAMDEDFNTGKAVGHLMRLARAINRLGNHKKGRKRGGPVVREALKAFELVASGTGLMEQATADFLEEVKVKRLAVLGVTREEIDVLLADRGKARSEKNWALADTLREELEARQIMVMDGSDGVEWRVRLQPPREDDDE